MSEKFQTSADLVLLQVYTAVQIMKVFTSVKNEGMLSIHTPHNFNATCDEAVIPQQMTKHARKHTHTHSHTHKSSHQFRWYGWEEPAALMLVLMVLGILPMPVGEKNGYH